MLSVDIFGKICKKVLSHISLIFKKYDFGCHITFTWSNTVSSKILFESSIFKIFIIVQIQRGPIAPEFFVDGIFCSQKLQVLNSFVGHMKLHKYRAYKVKNSANDLKVMKN